MKEYVVFNKERMTLNKAKLYPQTVTFTECAKRIKKLAEKKTIVILSQKFLPKIYLH